MNDGTGRAVGWYRDPTQPKRHRYWDGEQWQDPRAGVLPAQRREPPDQDTVRACSTDLEARDA